MKQCIRKILSSNPAKTRTKMARGLVMLSMVTSGTLAANAYFILDWDKIEHWTGEGENRAALIVQFNVESDPYAHVWGFRWNSEDYENGTPSGEDLFRAVAGSSDDLLLFTQYTGWMGSTVCGIGYFDPETDNVSEHLTFDFDQAKTDEKISFDYFSPNVTMGQTKAPGNATPIYCSRAINESVSTHILEHPINAREYGYAAYDYDHWVADSYLAANPAKMLWESGWYDGYWSYWVGGVDSDDLSYSGLGMTSRKLTDGQVDLWSYTLLDRDSFAYGEAVEPGELPLDYKHVHGSQTGTQMIMDDTVNTPLTGTIYTVAGQDTGLVWPDDNTRLRPGVYIIRDAAGSSRKVIVR